MIALAVGVASLAAWLYLLLGRGAFWLARPRDPAIAGAPGGAWPHVVAVVPARDEAETIGACIESLLRQDYSGPLSVVLVDDDSSDATAANARAAARACHASERLAIVEASPRPLGWTGKLWALQCGLGHVSRHGEAPQYLLFTDADIVHCGDSVSALVARARRDRLGMVSVMAKLRCASLVERAFVPAFVFFFQMLYPFAWVNRADRRTAAAAGGCMLVERAALEACGGLAIVRGELIDDCALARSVKSRRTIWLGLTERVHSIRPYRSLAQVRGMISRSAYAQLRFSPVLLAVTVLTMALTYAAPPVLAIAGEGLPRVLGALAWLAMALAFQPTTRFYRTTPLWGAALPAIAAVYVLFTLDSAYQAACGRAGQWKGRVYRVPPARP